MSFIDDSRFRKHSTFFLLVISIGFSFLFSCNSRQGAKKQRVISTRSDSHEFAEQLSAIFPAVDTSANEKKLRPIAENMRLAYQLNEYAPVWLSGAKATKASEKLLNELDQLQGDGLDPEKYHLSALRQLYDSLGSSTTDINKLIAFDTAFTFSYLQAAHDLLMGEIMPVKADTLWFHTNDTVWNAAEHLAAKDADFPSLEVYRSKVPTYTLMREQYQLYTKLATDSQLLAAMSKVSNASYARKPDSATAASIKYIIQTELPWANVQSDTLNEMQQLISTYQYYNDVKVTGRLDSFTVARLARTPQQMKDELRLNMERVRWMGKDIGDQYIVVDIPVMELFFRKGGENVMHMRTVVGKPERQTPSLVANMANVVINPPWGVPPTIMKKDVLPGMSKSGLKYLKKKGLQVYDRKGNMVDASRITQANYKRYVFKQAPGDDNSLGYVKFNLPNKWDIYLHDTPHRDDFPRRNRFLSSGCVRLEQPQQMALYILGTLENKRYTQERLDSVIQTHKTRWEILKTKIPVHIVYLTIFEDTTGKHLRYLRDIYNRDERLLSALK